MSIPSALAKAASTCPANIAQGTHSQQPRHPLTTAKALTHNSHLAVAVVLLSLIVSIVESKLFSLLNLIVESKLFPLLNLIVSIVESNCLHC